MLNLIGHKVQPQAAIETTTFGDIVKELYNDKLQDINFVPNITFTPTDDRTPKAYFTLWYDVDGEDYRQFIRVSDRLALESSEPGAVLAELANNFPIYVARTDKAGLPLVDRQGNPTVTLTFSVEGNRKAIPIAGNALRAAMNMKKAAPKVSGLPA